MTHQLSIVSRLEELTASRGKATGQAAEQAAEVAALTSEIAEVEARVAALDAASTAAAGAGAAGAGGGKAGKASKGGKRGSVDAGTGVPGGAASLSSADRTEYHALKATERQQTADLRVALDKLKREHAGDEGGAAQLQEHVDALTSRKGACAGACAGDEAAGDAGWEHARGRSYLYAPAPTHLAFLNNLDNPPTPTPPRPQRRSRASCPRRATAWRR